MAVWVAMAASAKCVRPHASTVKAKHSGVSDSELVFLHNAEHALYSSLNSNYTGQMRTYEESIIQLALVSLQHVQHACRSAYRRISADGHPIASP